MEKRKYKKNRTWDNLIQAFKILKKKPDIKAYQLRDMLKTHYYTAERIIDFYKKIGVIKK